MFTTHYNGNNQFFDIDNIKSDYKNAALSISSKKVRSPFKNIEEAKEFHKKLDGIFNFRNMSVISESLSTIFRDNILLLSNNNEIVICNKKFLKTTSVSLIMSKKINATVIGRVINNPELPIDATNSKNYIPEDSEGNKITGSMLNGGAAFIIMNYLQHFVNLDVEKNLYIIQAIGVEYS